MKTKNSNKYNGIYSNRQVFGEKVFTSLLLHQHSCMNEKIEMSKMRNVRHNQQQPMIMKRRRRSTVLCMSREIVAARQPEENIG